MNRSFGCAALVCGTMVASLSVAYADEPARPWTDSADFGLVLTTGNSQNLNFALGNKFKFSWSNAELTFDAGALRNENTATDYTFDGTTLTKTKTKAVTAESYLAAVKYRQNVTPRFYWFTEAAWVRNTFAGIDQRYLAGGGVGYALVKDGRNLLRGEVAADYTHQSPSATDENYASLHLFLGYEYKISDTAKLTEDLNLFDNLQTTDDWRGSSVTAVTASLTSKLAIKVSYSVLYVNKPPTLEVPDTVAPIGPGKIVAFDKTDTILAATLVVNF